jgi:hypothetical protein
MCLRNAVAASSPEDVVGRNIPVLTGALSCVHLKTACHVTRCSDLQKNPNFVVENGIVLNNVWTKSACFFKSSITVQVYTEITLKFFNNIIIPCTW